MAVALGALAWASGARAEDRIAEIKNQYPPCTKAPSKPDEEAARKAHKAALSAFDAKNWDEAVKQWTLAYGFDCSRPRVFKNLGQAQEQGGHPREAVAMFELLMERAASEVTDDLPPHVHELRLQVEELDRKEDAEKAASDKKATVAATAKPGAEPKLERPLGVVPWVVTGVGGGALVAGGVLVGVGLSSAGDAADQCADPTARTGCPQDAVDQGESGELMSQIGQGLLYGGAGTAALGLILQFAVNGERPVKESAGLELPMGAVLPIAGPERVGVTWAGRF